MSKLVIKKEMKGRFITLEKDYLVYKAVKGAIVQLLLPAGTKVNVPRNYNQNQNFRLRKLRADQAVVMAIIPREYFPKHLTRKLGGYEYETLQKVDHKFASKWSRTFYYQMGKLVKPVREFNTMTHNPCASGIHFFVDLIDAERWQ